MRGFLADINTVENTKGNSIIRNAYLSIGTQNANAIPKPYKWLQDFPAVSVILHQLSRYPFLHTDKVVTERRFEEMGYTKYQSVCCHFLFSIDIMLIP